MNTDIIMGTTTTTTTTTTSSDLQLGPPSPDAQDIFRRSINTSDISVAHIQPITTIRPHQQNPRKKRTKMIRFHNNKSVIGVAGSSSSHHSGSHSGIITKKKPDPSAPKITRPCTECGKRFWSWKALFGHMRCHPERPWRGINPPPNLHHHPPPPEVNNFTNVTTEEDEYVAACLLLLANTTTTAAGAASYHHQYLTESETRFECSSCKKVFGSHQALGGHRASHKNVKGCFAITRNDEFEEGEFEGVDSNNNNNMAMVLGSGQQHRCSICFKIFSSGQALGGHKRCHWEKEDVTSPTKTTTPFSFDLNSPPPNESTCPVSDLDLRLGL